MRRLLPSVLVATFVCAACLALPAAQAADPAAPIALAPGVLVTIPPDRQERETYSTHDIIEILHGIPGIEWKPEFTPTSQTLKDMATAASFRRDIWCLQFTFKPVRMLWVDVPQPSGKMQRKLVWYLVYNVKNTPGHLRPMKKEDGTYEVKQVDHTVRFFPQFVLESHEYQKSYLDRLTPVAVRAIQAKEDPNRKLLSSVEISNKPVEVSTDLVDNSVWGVATWEDVDPRIDTFSVFVQGLTNAYQWSDAPDDFKPGDPPGKGRELVGKSLMLNFWRPGDEYVEDQRIIRYGMPGKVDYSWVYR